MKKVNFTNKIARRKLFICTTGGVPQKSSGASVLIFYQYIKKFKGMGFKILHLLVLEDNNTLDSELDEYIKEMGTTGSFDILIYKTNSF